MIGNKRKLEYQHGESSKHIKLNHSILEPFIEKAEALLTATNIVVETFREKLIYQYKTALLNRIIQALKAKNPIKAIEKILAENWHTFKHSILCYTAMPEDDITLFLCDIVNVMSENENNKKKSALHLLMPGISLKSIKDGYPNLNTKDTIIQEILKTHVISHCGQYLLPIRILLDMNLKTSCDEKFDNPYYNFKLGAKSDFIVGETCERLFSHSDNTEALRDAKLRHHQSLAEDQSLYAELTKLKQALYFNGKEGVGSEENAGLGVYAAILNFNDYYCQLDKKQIHAIPTALKAEIKKILSLSSDQEMNFNATEVIDTCVSTRRQLLNDAMNGHEEKLMTIHPGLENQKKLWLQIKDKFKKCQENLIHSLENNYNGSDKFIISQSLLTHLNVVPQISSMEDVEDLLSFKTEELIVILDKYEKLAGDIVRQLENIESLIMFFINTPCDKLQIVFPKMVRFLTINNLLENTESLVIYFITLEPEKLKVIAKYLLSDISNNQLITGGKQLAELLKPLSSVQRAIVFKELKKHISISELIHLDKNIDFLNFLSVDDCTLTMNEIEPCLPYLIKNAIDLQHVLTRLLPEKRNFILNVVTKYLSEKEIKNNGFLLGCFLEYLSFNKFMEYIGGFSSLWSELINDPVGFTYLIAAISQPKRMLVFKEIIGHMNLSFIFNGRYSVFFINELTLDECEIFLENIKDYINIAFDDIEYYNYFFSALSSDKHTLFFNKINEQVDIKKIVKKTSDLKFINYLHLDECDWVLNKVGDIIKGYDLETLIDFLSIDKIIFVFDKIKNNLDMTDVVINPFFLGCYIESLPEEVCMEFLKDVSLLWNDFIKGSADLENLFKGLSLKKQSLVFNEIQKWIDIFSFVKKSYDLRFLNNLPALECLIVLENLETRWSRIIKKSTDLEFIFEELALEKHNIVFDSITKHFNISSVVLNVYDLNFLYYLSSVDCTVVLRDIQWNNMINTIEDLKELFDERLSDSLLKNIFYEVNKTVSIIDLCKKVDDLSFLDKLEIDEFEFILQNIGHHWNDLIKTGMDLTDLFDSISSERHAIIFKIAKNYLHVTDLIEDVEDLHFIKYLYWDEFEFVLEEIRHRWSDIIHGGEEFKELLDSLSSGKRMLIFEEIKDNRNMANMFVQFKDLGRLLKSLPGEECIIIQNTIEQADVLQTQPYQNLLFLFNQEHKEMSDDISHSKRLDF